MRRSRLGAIISPRKGHRAKRGVSLYNVSEHRPVGRAGGHAERGTTAAKGLAILASDADPSLVPPATLLFALGMVGLHVRLEGRGGPLGTVGVLLAWAAVAASAVNLIGLVLSVPAPGDPDAPTRC